MYRVHATMADLPTLAPVCISSDQNNALPEILDAAVRVFDELGYDATSLNEIAVQAGVSKSLVCYFFPSKASIAVTVINLAYPDGVFMGAERTIEDPLDAIIWAAQHVATNALHSPTGRVALALRYHPDVRSWNAPPLFSGWYARITDYLAEARTHGRVRTATPLQDEARLIVAGVAGLIAVARSTGDVLHLVDDAVRITSDRLHLLKTRR